MGYKLNIGTVPIYGANYKHGLGPMKSPLTCSLVGQGRTFSSYHRRKIEEPPKHPEIRSFSTWSLIG